MNSKDMRFLHESEQQKASLLTVLEGLSPDDEQCLRTYLLELNKSGTWGVIAAGLALESLGRFELLKMGVEP